MRLRGVNSPLGKQRPDGLLVFFFLEALLLRCLGEDLRARKQRRRERLHLSAGQWERSGSAVESAQWRARSGESAVERAQ